ncbi:hypothetical protein LNP74_05775 [Klebsiella pneumoniae subsp. pneumoniae]|nr:hypothetical protein [Klebsiella pneumoniae subsp. pneumoniae]
MINLRCSGVFFCCWLPAQAPSPTARSISGSGSGMTQHKTALQQSQALFATLRVLGIQFHPQEGVRPCPRSTLHYYSRMAASGVAGRPPGGSLTQLDTTTVLPQIKRLCGPLAQGRR